MASTSPPTITGVPQFGAGADDSTPTVRNFPDGSLRRWTGTGWVVEQYAPQESQTVENLGNGVFRDDTGFFTLEPVQGYAGTGIPAEPRRQYITAAQAEQLVDPKAANGSGNALGWAQLAQNAVELEESIRQWNIAHGLELEKLQLQQDQYALAERMGHREEARGLAGDVAATQANMNSSMISLAGMKNDAAALNAQMQFQAASGNADRRMQAAQAAANRAVQMAEMTEAARGRNIDQQIQIAKSIAEFRRDPGDIVANIGAEQEFGSISTALAKGFNGLTDDAMAPLVALQGQQDNALFEGQRLGAQSTALAGALNRGLDPNAGVTNVAAPTFTPEIPNLQQPDVVGLFNEFLGQNGGATTTAPAQSGAPLSALSPEQQAMAPDFVQKRNALFNVPKMANGGVVSGSAAIVGDPKTGDKANPELVQMTPDGLMVTPLDDLPKMADGGLLVNSGFVGHNVAGAQSGSLPGGGGYYRNPDGGTGTIGNVTPEGQYTYLRTFGGLDDAQASSASGYKLPTEEAAQPFSFNGPTAPRALTPEEALARARANLKASFDPAMAAFRKAAPDVGVAGGVPTAVGVSAPGTSMDLQEAASGLAAAGAGVRRSTFFNDLVNSRATGINSGVNRRTR